MIPVTTNVIPLTIPALCSSICELKFNSPLYASLDFLRIIFQAILVTAFCFVFFSFINHHYFQDDFFAYFFSTLHTTFDDADLIENI